MQDTRSDPKGLHDIARRRQRRPLLKHGLCRGFDGSLDDGLPPRLVAFEGGVLARVWAALSRDARRAHPLGHLSRAFGENVSAPREMAEAVWVDHPWSRGGYNETNRTGGNPDAVARLAVGPKALILLIAETFWIAALALSILLLVA